jgi:hypothetical protein
LFDRERLALDRATRVDEVKAIRDEAEAMRAYLRLRRASLALQNRCAEMKIRAERRLGAMLAALPKQHGARPADAGSQPVTPLAELGITRMQAHRWQLLATVDEESFAAHVSNVESEGGELTTAGVLLLARALKAEQGGVHEWTLAADERGGGVLPLEALWPTPQFLLRNLAERSVQLACEISSFVGDAYGEAGAGADIFDALAEARTAFAAAADIVQRAALALIERAATAPSTPVPWGGEPAALLAINARQKNYCGYCAIAGCWEAAEVDGYCSLHRAEDAGSLLAQAVSA